MVRYKIGKKNRQEELSIQQVAKYINSKICKKNLFYFIKFKFLMRDNCINKKTHGAYVPHAKDTQHLITCQE